MYTWDNLKKDKETIKSRMKILFLIAVIVGSFISGESILSWSNLPVLLILII